MSFIGRLLKHPMVTGFGADTSAFRDTEFFKAMFRIGIRQVKFVIPAGIAAGWFA